MRRENVNDFKADCEWVKATKEKQWNRAALAGGLGGMRRGC